MTRRFAASSPGLEVVTVVIVSGAEAPPMTAAFVVAFGPRWHGSEPGWDGWAPGWPWPYWGALWAGARLPCAPDARRAGLVFAGRAPARPAGWPAPAERLRPGNPAARGKNICGFGGSAGSCL